MSLNLLSRRPRVPLPLCRWWIEAMIWLNPVRINDAFAFVVFMGGDYYYLLFIIYCDDVIMCRQWSSRQISQIFHPKSHRPNRFYTIGTPYGGCTPNSPYPPQNMGALRENNVIFFWPNDDIAVK